MTAYKLNDLNSLFYSYLEKQREIKNAGKPRKDDESESDNESVDDDEFDEYLDKITAAGD